MKSLFRSFLLNLFSLWLITSILPVLGVVNLNTLYPAAITLTLLDLVLKPLINLLLLPINLVTFGLLGWLSSLAVIYATTLLTPSFNISPLVLESPKLLNLQFPSFHFGLFSTLLILTAILVILKKLLSNTLK